MYIRRKVFSQAMDWDYGYENEMEERLYSTGDYELDEILERAFCEGYEAAQREFTYINEKGEVIGVGGKVLKNRLKKGETLIYDADLTGLTEGQKLDLKNKLAKLNKDGNVGNDKKGTLRSERSATAFNDKEIAANKKNRTAKMKELGLNKKNYEAQLEKDKRAYASRIKATKERLLAKDAERKAVAKAAKRAHNWKVGGAIAGGAALAGLGAYGIKKAMDND